MSFLGPLEALWPAVEPFAPRQHDRHVHEYLYGAGSFQRYARQTINPLKPIKPWEKTNSVRANSVTFGRPHG